MVYQLVIGWGIRTPNLGAGHGLGVTSVDVHHVVMDLVLEDELDLQLDFEVGLVVEEEVDLEADDWFLLSLAYLLMAIGPRRHLTK